jgi:galactokinase/mevalonate kinase-like predicted kinase
VNLGGGAIDAVPAATVNVAIDRRAWCRVETGVSGLHVESKDTLQKASVTRLDELGGSGSLALVGAMLRAQGVESGVRVETRCRVPAGAGLGEDAALAVAVAAAVSAARGRDTSPHELLRLLGDASGLGERQTARRADYATALRGGVVGIQAGADGLRVEPLPVDPARVEESLLLLDVGEEENDGAGDEETGESGVSGRPGSAGQEVWDTLVAGRFEDVGEIWARDWEARRTPTPGTRIDRLVTIARAAGGAARVSAGGRVVAIWAPPGDRGPGRREAVVAALEAEDFKAFPARVDLRGLDTA